jgi:hypothetical protein
MKDLNDFMLVESEGDQLRKMTVQRDKLAEALRSIAANTCCGRCQEAALVAQAVLTVCGFK